MGVQVTETTNTSNHYRADYDVDNVFVAYPSKQRYLTFVNGTASERTIEAGTLVGVTTADPTIGQPVESDGNDGSEVPQFVVLEDIVIPAGALEEVEGLVGENGIIYEDKVVLEKVGDTLETVITGADSIVLGQTIRNALLNANSKLRLEPAAKQSSAVKDTEI
jgi:hypothetical protein